MYFEYWQSRSNYNWYWHLKSSSNGQVIAQGEGYVNKSDCLHAINLVKSCSNAAVYLV